VNAKSFWRVAIVRLLSARGSDCDHTLVRDGADFLPTGGRSLGRLQGHVSGAVGAGTVMESRIRSQIRWGSGELPECACSFRSYGRARFIWFCQSASIARPRDMGHVIRLKEGL
jgi:hypothetical protein